MAKAFINDSRYNRLEGRTLRASSIFKWFAEDFDNDVVGFFVKYARDALKKKLNENYGDIKILYLDYDWSLNGK